jgi:purine nucleosidase
MISPERFRSPPRAGPNDVEIIVEPTAQSLIGQSPDRKKIILDCDPGHDDAVALLLAHGNPDIELLAVTTVVGNQTL